MQSIDTTSRPAAGTPASTHEAIERLVIEEVGRLGGRPNSFNASFAGLGIDAGHFADVIHRIEARYGMRFHGEWLRGIDSWADLVACIEQHLRDSLDSPRAAAAAVRPATTPGRGEILLTSTDYLGLSTHPDVIAAAKEAIDCFGCGLVPRGHHAAHEKLVGGLERRIARFLGVPRAAVFPAEHGPASAIFHQLAGPADLVLCDHLLPARLVRAAEASPAACRLFRHGDVGQLDRLLREHRRSHRRAIIVVEGICGMTGEPADLAGLVELRLRHEAMLCVDESDSLGTLGGGRGLAHHVGIDRDEADLWIASDWRAFGSGGGYVAGGDAVIRYLENVPPEVVRRGCPPPVAAAARGCLELLERDPRPVRRLAERAELFRKLSADCDLEIGSSEGPVITIMPEPLQLGEAAGCQDAARLLLGRGVRLRAVRFPGIGFQAEGLQVRLTATIDEPQVAHAVASIAEVLA